MGLQPGFESAKPAHWRHLDAAERGWFVRKASVRAPTTSGVGELVRHVIGGRPGAEAFDFASFLLDLAQEFIAASDEISAGERRSLALAECAQLVYEPPELPLVIRLLLSLPVARDAVAAVVAVNLVGRNDGPLIQAEEDTVSVPVGTFKIKVP